MSLTANRRQQIGDTAEFINRTHSELQQLTVINNTTLSRVTNLETNVTNLTTNVTNIVNEGALTRQGTWNATTNITSPGGATLGNSGVGGTKGHYYVVSTTGTTSIDGISTWTADDWIVHNGTTWEKVNNTGGGGGGAVASVNGNTGVVVLTSDDIDNSTATFTTGGAINLTSRVNIVNFGGATTATLPAAPTNGDIITVCNYGTGTTTIQSTGGDFIEDTSTTSISLTGQNEKITFVFGSQGGADIWNIV